MKHTLIRTSAFALAALFACLLPQAAQAQSAQWSIGYLENTSSTNLSTINWSALTVIADFTVGPNSNGTMACDFGNSSCTSGTFPTTRAALISAAHSHGVKVIMSLTDGVGNTGFGSATSSGTVGTFVSNIITLVNAIGYDGVTIDWESNFNGNAQMAPFLAALRTALGSKILDATCAWSDVPYWAAHHSSLDRVEFMTFDLNGNWNPYSWFNSALNPDSSNQVIGVSSFFNKAQSLGMPSTSYTIGIPFYGYTSTGGNTGPRQSPSSGSDNQITYKSLLSTYPTQLSSGSTVDSVSKTPWFSISGGWVEYDNPASVTAKLNYAKANNIGGWILFSISKDGTGGPLQAAVAAAMGGSPPPSLPTISSFSASPSSITSGSSSTLTWSISGATTVSINNGVGTVSGSSKVVSPTATTTCIITATDSSGSNTASTTVTVNPAGTAPTISSFTALPTSISSGSSSTLSWATSGATTLSISGGVGTVTGSTSHSVSPTVTTSYLLTATNGFGTTTKSVTVTVTPAALPTISSFTASPVMISAGGSTTLSWSTTGASSLSISPRTVVVTGFTSLLVSPSITTTYVLTATNGTGSVTRSATVTVNPVAPPTQLKGTITLTGNVKVQ